MDLQGDLLWSIQRKFSHQREFIVAQVERKVRWPGLVLVAVPRRTGEQVH